MKRANEWTRKQFADWGLANAQVEKWGHFGRGWSFERSVVTMVSPSAVPLVALPKAWTPGTRGGRAGQGQAGPHQLQVGLRALQGQAGRDHRVPVPDPLD